MDKGNYGLLAYQIDIEHVVKIVILLSSHCYQKNKKMYHHSSIVAMCTVEEFDSCKMVLLSYKYAMMNLQVLY